MQCIVGTLAPLSIFNRAVEHRVFTFKILLGVLMPLALRLFLSNLVSQRFLVATHFSIRWTQAIM